MNERNTQNEQGSSDAKRLAGETCKELVSGPGWDIHECGKSAKVELNGKFYCGVHNPQRADKIAKRQARNDAYRQRNEMWDRADKIRKACEGVPTEQLEPGLLARLLKEVKE